MPLVTGRKSDSSWRSGRLGSQALAVVDGFDVMDTSTLSIPELQAILRYLPDPTGPAGRAGRRAHTTAGSRRPGVPRLSDRPWIRWHVLQPKKGGSKAVDASARGDAKEAPWDSTLSEEPSEAEAFTLPPADSLLPGGHGAGGRQQGSTEGGGGRSGGESEGSSGAGRSEFEGSDGLGDGKEHGVGLTEEEMVVEEAFRTGKGLWKLLARRIKIIGRLMNLGKSARFVPLDHPILNVSWLRHGIEDSVPIRCILRPPDGDALARVGPGPLFVRAATRRGFRFQTDALSLDIPDTGKPLPQFGSNGACAQMLAAAEVAYQPGPGRGCCDITATWDGPALVRGARHAASSKFCFSAAVGKQPLKACRTVLVPINVGAPGHATGVAGAKTMVRVTPLAPRVPFNPKRSTALGFKFEEVDLDDLAMVLHDETLLGSLDLDGRNTTDSLRLHCVISGGYMKGEDRLLLLATAAEAENAVENYRVSWNTEDGVLTIAPKSNKLTLPELLGILPRVAFANSRGIVLEVGERVVEARLVDPIVVRCNNAAAPAMQDLCDAERQLLLKTTIERRTGVISMKVARLYADADAGKTAKASSEQLKMRHAWKAMLATLGDFRDAHYDLATRKLQKVIAVRRAERVLRMQFLPLVRPVLFAIRMRLAAAAKEKEQAEQTRLDEQRERATSGQVPPRSADSHQSRPAVGRRQDVPRGKAGEPSSAGSSDPAPHLLRRKVRDVAGEGIVPGARARPSTNGLSGGTVDIPAGHPSIEALEGGHAESPGASGVVASVRSAGRGTTASAALTDAFRISSADGGHRSATSSRQALMRRPAQNDEPAGAGTDQAPAQLGGLPGPAPAGGEPLWPAGHGKYDSVVGLPDSWEQHGAHQPPRARGGSVAYDEAGSDIGDWQLAGSEGRHRGPGWSFDDASKARPLAADLAACGDSVSDPVPSIGTSDLGTEWRDAEPVALHTGFQRSGLGSEWSVGGGSPDSLAAAATLSGAAGLDLALQATSHSGPPTEPSGAAGPDRGWQAPESPSAAALSVLPPLPPGWKWSSRQQHRVPDPQARGVAMSVAFEPSFGWGKLFQKHQEVLEAMATPGVDPSEMLVSLLGEARTSLGRSKQERSMVEPVSRLLRESGTQMKGMDVLASLSGLRRARMLLREVFASAPAGMFPELQLNDSWTGSTWADGWRFFTIRVPPLENSPTLEVSVIPATCARASTSAPDGQDALERRLCAQSVIWLSSQVLPTPADYEKRSAMFGHGMSRVVVSSTDECYIHSALEGPTADCYFVAVWVDSSDPTPIQVATRTWTRPAAALGEFVSVSPDEAAAKAAASQVAEQLDSSEPDRRSGGDSKKWDRFLQIVDRITRMSAQRDLPPTGGEARGGDSSTDSESSGVSYLDEGVRSTDHEGHAAYENRRQRRRDRRAARWLRKRAREAMAEQAQAAYQEAIGKRSRRLPFDLGAAASSVAKARKRAEVACARALKRSKLVKDEGLDSVDGPKLTERERQRAAEAAADDAALAAAEALGKVDRSSQAANERTLALLDEPEFAPEPDPSSEVYQPHFALSLGLDAGVELLLGDNPSMADLDVIRKVRETALRRGEGEADILSRRVEHAAASLDLLLRATRVATVPLVDSTPAAAGKPARATAKAAAARLTRAVAGGKTLGAAIDAGLDRRANVAAAAKEQRLKAEMRQYRQSVRVAKRELRKSARRARRAARSNSGRDDTCAPRGADEPSGAAASRLAARLGRARRDSEGEAAGEEKQASAGMAVEAPPRAPPQVARPHDWLTPVSLVHPRMAVIKLPRVGASHTASESAVS